MRIDQLNPNHHPSNDQVITGWWLVYLPLWKMMEFVSWDDEIPNWMESHKIHVPNRQIGLKPHDQSGSWPGWWLNMIQQHILTNMGNVWLSYLRSPKFNQTTTRHIFRPSFDQRRKRHHRAESRKLTSPWSQCQPHVLPWPWPWPDLGVPWNLALDSYIGLILVGPSNKSKMWNFDSLCCLR